MFCAASNDMHTHIYAAERLSQLVVRTMGGHKDAIMGSFFLKDSLNVSLYELLLLLLLTSY